MNKDQIWKAAVAKHQHVIDDFEKRIKEMESSVSEVGESTYDNATLGQKSATYEIADTLKEQLAFAQEEMDLLNKISTDVIHDRVQLGSVVKTDKRIFFLSVSVEDFEVDGKELFGLSAKTPLGKAMLTKFTGDTFSYNDTNYIVQSIF